MSDRTQLFNLPTGAGGTVELYMDGESGTWRLFLADHSCVDFSLSGLREFKAALVGVLRQIEADPQEYNAEVRRSTWAALE